MDDRMQRIQRKAKELKGRAKQEAWIAADKSGAKTRGAGEALRGKAQNSHGQGTQRRQEDNALSASARMAGQREKHKAAAGQAPRRCDGARASRALVIRSGDRQQHRARIGAALGAIRTSQKTVD